MNGFIGGGVAFNVILATIDVEAPFYKFLYMHHMLIKEMLFYSILLD